MRDHFVDDLALAADDAPPVGAEAQPLGDGEPDGFERRQIGEQLVDLEGARDAALHACMRAQRA